MSQSQSENDRPVRVLVVDDQQIIQEGISAILSYQEGIEVVGVASNGQGLSNKPCAYNRM